MCTVTYIPSGRGAFLTSNRDERISRAPALPPSTRVFGNTEITCPTDPQADGSWIALRGDGQAAVLLNGGFERHTPTPPYRQSRGAILLEISATPSPLAYFSAMCLTRIEPFTLILLQNGRLHRCTWDGRRKHIGELDARLCHIWSSATLYDAETQHSRAGRLHQWLDGRQPTRQAILDFHLSDGIRYGGAPGNTGLRTVSVTSIDLTSAQPAMHYLDLQSGQTATAAPLRKPAPAGARLADRWRAFTIRLRHWEYWPLHVVYLPVALYHAWLSLKAGSPFFFSASNPSIETGGMFGESKAGILDRIDARFRPASVRVSLPAGMPEITRLMHHHGLTYPVIAKPDIGERGWRVEKIRDDGELAAYAASATTAFLLQEFVDLPLEFGVFYYRLPGEATGTVSSVVQKEFLSVTGNGTDTLEKLVRRHDRAFLQRRRLRGRIDWQAIPAASETVVLNTIGNHCLGTAFLNANALITPEMTATFDRLSQSIDGFYFGRFDLRCASPDDLRTGRNLRILELNGAGAEPAHIYQPGFPLAEGYRVLFRHWYTLYRISCENHRAGVPYMSFRQALFFWKQHRKGRH